MHQRRASSYVGISKAEVPISQRSNLISFDTLKNTVITLIKLKPSFWRDLSFQNDKHAITISYLHSEAQIDYLSRIKTSLDSGVYAFDNIVSYLPIRDYDFNINLAKNKFLKHKIGKYLKYRYDYLVVFVGVQFKDYTINESELLLFGFDGVKPVCDLIYYDNPYHELLNMARYITITAPCGHCKKEKCRMMCDNCETVYYCNDLCKKLDYENHKSFCDPCDDSLEESV